MKTVFLVSGSGGSNEDFREWVVCGYEVFEEAEKKVAALQKKLEQLRTELPPYRPVEWDFDHKEFERLNGICQAKLAQIDPFAEWHCFLEGIRYSIYHIKVYEEFDNE